MAEPATDVFGSLNVDSIVKNAMPQPSFDYGKAQEGVTKAATAEVAAKKPILERMQSTLEADRAEVDAKYKGIEPVKIEKWDADKERQKFSTDPLQAMGSFGSIAALIASAFTRQPLINAFNGMGSAIDAINKKNDKDYDRAFDGFKTNMDVAIKNHNIQQQAYDTAIKKLNTDHTSGVAELQAVATQFGDQKTLAMIEAGMIPEIVQARHADTNAWRGMISAMPQIEAWDAKHKAAAQLRKEGKSDVEIYNQVYSPQATAKVTEDARRRKEIYDAGIKEYMNKHGITDESQVPYEVRANLNLRAMGRGGAELSDDSAKLIAQRVIAGDPKATTGFARSSEAMRKVTDSLVKELGSGRAAAEALRVSGIMYAADLSGSRELGKRAAFLTLAENEATQLIPRVRDASARIDRTEFPTLNKIILAAKEGTGDENVVQFGVAANALIPVYARVLKPVGPITEGDMKRAEDILNKAWSQGQINAALNQMELEMKSARRALELTREEFPPPQRGTPQPPPGANQGAPGAAAPPVPVAPPASTPPPAATTPPPVSPKPVIPPVEERKHGQEYVVGGEKVIWDEKSKLWYTPAEWKARGN